ncbi:MAG: heavy-metal-associated domain-containing protein [Sulfurimonas sp.]
MKQTFQVENVKCGGCANTLMTKLKEEFGKIEVDLDKMPRTITLDIEDERLDALRKALRNLGYPMSDEDLDFIDNNTAKAKSFVSCAIGKFELSKK